MAIRYKAYRNADGETVWLQEGQAGDTAAAADGTLTQIPGQDKLTSNDGSTDETPIDASFVQNLDTAVSDNETTTSLSLNANVLTFTDEEGNDTDIDLSLYLDDTNLSRIVSGVLDGGTGIATFTRSDASTFTVDFSALNDQGAINTAIANHEAAADPHPQYTTTAEASAAAPIQSVNGETGTLTNYAKTNVNNNFSTVQSGQTPTLPAHLATKQYVDDNAGVSAIDDLDDVDTTTAAPANGDLLQWDGSNWVPVSPVQGYTYFPIWAEENGGLANNQYEWSWGNGATGAAIGIALGLGAELFAVSFNAENFGTDISFNFQRNGTNVATETFTANNQAISLSTPQIFAAGDRFGFQTGTLSGSFSDARVCGWFRVANQVIAQAVTDQLFTPDGLTQAVSVAPDTAVTLSGYGQGNRTGTEAFGIAVDASGKIIERIIPTPDVQSASISAQGFSSGTEVAIPGLSFNVTLSATGKIESTLTYSATRAGGTTAVTSFRIQIGGVDGILYLDTLSTFNDVGAISFTRSGLAAGTYNVQARAVTTEPITINAAELKATGTETV